MSARFRVCILGALALGACDARAADVVYRGKQSIDEGGQYHEAVYVDLGDEEYPSKVMDGLRGMPKLKALVVGGPRYTDEHLAELAKIASLESLVLDSTDVTDGAIERLRRDRPELVILRSQRWAMSKYANLGFSGVIESDLSQEHPELRRLFGDHYFHQARAVEFGRLPDIEMGPFDPLLNEELMPVKYLSTATRLSFGWTRINDAGMHYLDDFTNLVSLSIPSDELTAEGFRRISRFRKLEHLGIGGKKTDDDALQHIRNLKRLETLVMRRTAVQGPGLVHLRGLPRLQHVYLDFSQVRDLSELGELPSLTLLSLDETDIDDATLIHLAGCPNLDSLSMIKTRIGDAGIAHLQRLPRLRYLDLSNTQAGDAAVSHLKKLPALTTLNLNNTKVSNAGLAEIASFPKLKGLSLYGVPLDEAAIGILENLTGLEGLYVGPRREFGGDPELGGALLMRLRAALPNCTIY